MDSFEQGILSNELLLEITFKRVNGRGNYRRLVQIT